MKIFLSDPGETIFKLLQEGHAYESYDSLVIFNNLNSLMNDVLVERPKLIITEYNTLNPSELERVTEICSLHEIPIVILVSEQETLTNLKNLYDSYYVYPIIRDGLDQLISICHKFRPGKNLANRVDQRLRSFSKRKLPIVFKVVIVFLLVEPIMKIIYLWMMTDFTLTKVIDNVLNIPLGHKFIQFWFLFPVSGLLLLFFRRLFFVIFLFIQFYSIFMHLTYQKFTWPYVTRMPHASSLILLFINVLLIVYLFVSDERKIFVDMTKTWWRKQRRIEVDLECHLTSAQNDLFSGKVKNLSQAGAFILGNSDLIIGEKYFMDITGLDLSVDVVVRNKRQGSMDVGYGIEFVGMKNKQIRNLKEYIKKSGRA